METAQRSDFSNRGFTLVELMFAMLIIAIGLLGLLTAVNTGMEHNLKNQLRDEAVAVGESTMGNLKVRPFAQVSTSFTPVQVASRIRAGNLKYTVTRYSRALDTGKLVVVKVDWKYKGTPYSHEVMSLRSD